MTHKLNANKTYSFRVRATNDCGSSEYVVSDPISYKGATSPESVVAQVTEGSHYATIVWSASEDATQYFIESTTNGGESWSGVKKAVADAFTYDEATDSNSYTYFISTGKTYQFRVRAYNDLGTDGVSTESNEVALLTPGTPENFTVASAEAVNPTNYPVGERYSKVTVTLSWAPADNATKYVVRYSKDGGSEKLLKNINDPSVTSVTFGAVYMNGAEAAFSNCRFSSNSSSDGGGAVCLEDDSSAEFDACVFTNNSSDGYGGAFYMTDSGVATFVNTVLIGNEADEGGAIFASDEDVTLKLYHVTLVDNGSQSGGGGISLDSVGSAEIYNSIIYANYDMFGFASNVYANDSNVTAINNLTWIESDDWWTETGWEINGGNVTNTNVIELEDNNSLSSVLNRKTYELVDGSLAINAGDHDLTPEVVTDLNGKERNSKPDLGACEYVASSSAVVDDVFAELVDDLGIDW